MLSEPDASRSGNSGVVASSSTGRWWQPRSRRAGLCEGHERVAESELDHGTVCYAARTMAKAAGRTISTRLRTENPKARLMEDSLGKRPCTASDAGQSVSKDSWLYQQIHLNENAIIFGGICFAGFVLVFLCVPFLCVGKHGPRVHKINLAKNDDVGLVTKMTQETQSFPNFVQADSRRGATFPSAACGRMATDDGAAVRSHRSTS